MKSSNKSDMINEIININKKIKVIEEKEIYNTLNFSLKLFNKNNNFKKIFYEDYINYLDIYSNTINKIFDAINEEYFNEKTFEYYLLKLNLINENIEYYENLFNNIDIKTKTRININKSLDFNFRLLNKYILFAFKGKKKMKESYKSTLPSKIEEEAMKINNLMRNINLIYLKLHNKEFFHYQQETMDLAANIRSLAKDPNGLKILSDYLYKGIYESSCDGSICKLFQEFSIVDTNILDIIKQYRNFNDHEIRNNSKKVKVVLDYNKSVIGKFLPDKESDYLKIQLDLYTKIGIMLEEVYNTLNK